MLVSIFPSMKITSWLLAQTLSFVMTLLGVWLLIGMIGPHLGQAEMEVPSFPAFGVHALCNPLLTVGGTCEYAVSLAL